MSRRLRALFLNEGALGTGPIGHVRVESAIRSGLKDIDDVDARFRSIPPLGRLGGAAVRGVPGLRRADLDLQPFRWHMIQAASARRVLHEELAKGPLDVVHVVSHSIAMLMEREMRRTPILLSVDAPVWEVREMGLWRALRPHSRRVMSPSLLAERRVLSAAALVLPWSEWAQRGVAREAPTARSVTLHPGLDLDEFRFAPRSPRAQPRILFVGGRFEAKGGHDLLEAVSLLGPNAAAVDLVTKDLSDQPGVRVHRLSAGDDRLLELFRAADVFCLPSHGDACPWVVLEAMASGAAVVASSVGAIPEMLDHGRAGLVVPPRDPEALADALRELLESRGRREELARRARIRCEQHYDTRSQTTQLIELMRDAVSRFRPS